MSGSGGSDTDILRPGVDQGLAEFNRQRRSKLNLPDGWNDPPKKY